MHIGIPKEIKNHEYRVGLVPSGVAELVRRGHSVTVETAAGQGIGFSDDDYRQAGASIGESAEQVFAAADLIVKVKEPLEQEWKMIRSDQTLFTYLHLAPARDLTCALMDTGATCIAYETVTDSKGRLPLLAPMSEVAGRMSVQAGAMSLEKSHGGKGVLLGGVPGVSQGRVLVLGGGVVGSNAVQMAVGLGANVTVLDRSPEVLARLDQQYGNRIQTLYSTTDAVESAALSADLIIGAVLVPGASAPRLITKELVSAMEAGTVMVDVAIDQGGCFETSHPTTHADPTYLVDEVVHYCVANMPGAVPRTSTLALNNVTLPYVLELADKGVMEALAQNDHLREGLNVCRGQVTNREVGEAHGLDYTDPRQLLVA